MHCAKSRTETSAASHATEETRRYAEVSVCIRRAVLKLRKKEKQRLVVLVGGSAEKN